ncbi:hypothetical protein HYH03_003684 [Edaphochlamys debaryana]|uniref:Uncharacterized protein n=1 Tax=Edaphochlamys debaryana TaxID=47281 RepID=A0A835YCR2_9CHLO|nr:hypothetical protein HYH03_003684 [Edaphochlamys debaryana]|eukprot:KAG2498426.1 hypothetical protein HYH03_003684 [Edaphochlamys debaryana]
MRRLEDIPDYFRKYRRGRRRKAEGGADDTSDSDTDYHDSEGGATPPRRQSQRGRAGSSGGGARGGAAAARARAASTSQVMTHAPPPAQDASAGPASFFGLPMPGLPLFNAWRNRAASAPHIHGRSDGGAELQDGAMGMAAPAPALPFNILGLGLGSGGAGPSDGGAAALPLSTAGGHPMGQYGAPPGPKGAHMLPPLGQHMLPPIDVSGAADPHHAQHMPYGHAPPFMQGPGSGPGDREPSFGGGMGMAMGMGDAGAHSAGGAPVGSADGSLGHAGGAASGPGPAQGAGPSGGVVPLDSAMLMQLPSAALPPDMQISGQRSVLGRLFPRNSTLKLMHSLFDRWAAQDPEGDNGGAGPSGQSAGAYGAPGGPLPVPPYGQAPPGQREQWGAPPPPPQQGPRQAQGGAYGASGGPPVEAVAYITPGPGQGYPFGAAAFPASTTATVSSGGGSSWLGKRPRDESTGSGPSRKLQKGLSGMFAPLLSMVSFGRRNPSAGSAAATANAAAAGAAVTGSDATAVTGPGGSRGGGGGGTFSLGLDVPSIPDGGGLLSALDSKIFDELPSLTDGDALAQLVEQAAAAAAADGGQQQRLQQGGMGAGPSQAETEDRGLTGDLADQAGITSVSRESHLPTPFVVPEMQERVAPSSQGGAGAPPALLGGIKQEDLGAFGGAAGPEGGWQDTVAQPGNGAGQEQAQGQGQDAGGGSLLFRLSSTMSDYFRHLGGWGR